mmetsp:Transcript_58925/g.127973  ORF Transcript_58925/g.127973 Transcript_58925/m.127973 type:complete len:128 (-) Transcript_58925:149-532(-)|eukprot:3127835-Pleurochrysis_carterae.AAC.2
MQLLSCYWMGDVLQRFLELGNSNGGMLWPHGNRQRNRQPYDSKENRELDDARSCGLSCQLSRQQFQRNPRGEGRNSEKQEGPDHPCGSTHRKADLASSGRLSHARAVSSRDWHAIKFVPPSEEQVDH